MCFLLIPLLAFCFHNNGTVYLWKLVVTLFFISIEANYLRLKEELANNLFEYILRLI